MCHFQLPPYDDLIKLFTSIEHDLVEKSWEVGTPRGQKSSGLKHCPHFNGHRPSTFPWSKPLVEAPLFLSQTLGNVGLMLVHSGRLCYHGCRIAHGCRGLASRLVRILTSGFPSRVSSMKSPSFIMFMSPSRYSGRR